MMMLNVRLGVFSALRFGLQVLCLLAFKVSRSLRVGVGYVGTIGAKSVVRVQLLWGLLLGGQSLPRRNKNALSCCQMTHPLRPFRRPGHE